jgi:hypothetical protein
MFLGMQRIILKVLIGLINAPKLVYSQIMRRCGVVDQETTT